MRLEGEFYSIIARSRRAKDADWRPIYARLSSQTLTIGQIAWAWSRGLSDKNANVRRLAAMLVALSDIPMSETDQAWLRERMTDEPASAWIACALFKRGDRTDAVVAAQQAACASTDELGVLARRIRTPLC